MAKKLYWPLGDTLLFHVTVLTWVRLIDVFDLPNEREWLLRAISALGECGSLSICRKSKVVIAAILFLRSATLWMAPNPILKDIVPDISSSGLC